MEPVDRTLWGEHLAAGYFAARARRFLGSEFVLSSRGGEEFGRLRVHGPEGAQLEIGDTTAKIERDARSRYRVLVGGAEILVARATASAQALNISCAKHTYEARLDLLRNTAVARSSGGAEAARVAGGLANRSYEAFYDTEDEGSPPVVVFLLFYTVALRRRAFLASAKGGGAPNP